MRQSILTILFCLALSSCNKNEFYGPINTTIDSVQIDPQSNQLLIACEGNFQYGNASLSRVDLDSNSIQNDLFYKANNMALGDVFQSMFLMGDTLLCVLNNSNEIKLLDANTFTEIGSVDQISSPRYIEQAGSNRILVTSLYGNRITEIDLTTLKVINETKIEGWTEKIFRIKDTYYVCKLDSNQLVLLNQEKQWVQTLEIGFTPTYSDTNNHLIAVAGALDNENYVSIIDTKNLQIVTQKVGQVSGVAIDDNGVYILNQRSVDVYNHALTNHIKLFDHHAITPYGFALEKNQDWFFITDASDYISNGRVLGYNRKGEKLFDHETGIIPQAMIFRF